MLRNIFRGSFIFIVSLTVCIAGCYNGNTRNDTDISGKFVYSRGEVVYLKEILVFEKVVVDSVRLKESGEFSFKIPVDDVIILWIGTSEDNYITLICEKGETVQITGDIRSLPASYTVSGSPASELLHSLQEYTYAHYRQFDTLSMIWEKRKYDNDKLVLRDSLDKAALQIYEDQEQFVKQFVTDNMESLAAIVALYQIFGRVPILDEFEYIELYEQTAQVLKEIYPGNQHVNELSARVVKNRLILKEKQEIIQRLQPGNPVPELSLSDRDGAPASIKNFKGHTILINFWAATSPKSRKLNQELIQLHKLHSARGFLLFNVSFDPNQDIWKKAVSLDKLPGIHVNDQRSLSSPVMKMFNISELPHTILVDREGLIVGNGLTFDEINQKLFELLPSRRISTISE